MHNASLDSNAGLQSVHRPAAPALTRWLRHAVVATLLVALAPPSRAQSLGQWSGPFPWPYVITPPTGQTMDKEISHAALIPAGAHAGKVLLFSWQGQTYPNVDTFWFFNPDAPTDLVRLNQNINANIFCSGMSFDA